MPDGLPPLAHVPHLERLLAPDEVIIYTAKLHPLYGFGWLLAGLLALYGGIWLKPLWLFAVLLFGIYAIPFRNFEMAITTRRLLLRHGFMRLNMEGIMATKLEDWRVQQTLVQSFMHTGHLTLHVQEGKNLREITLPWIWHPITLVEALETLQMNEANHG